MGTDSIATAIEATVLQFLPEQVVDHGCDGMFGCGEVRGIREEHSTDAHVGDRDCFGRIDATVRSSPGAHNQIDAFPYGCIVRRYAEGSEVEEGIVRIRPLWLVESAPPGAIGISAAHVPSAPSFRCDPSPELWFVPVQQIAIDLILDGNVTVEEPWNNFRGAGHRRSGVNSQVMHLFIPSIQSALPARAVLIAFSSIPSFTCLSYNAR